MIFEDANIHKLLDLLYENCYSQTFIFIIHPPTDAYFRRRQDRYKYEYIWNMLLSPKKISKNL